MLGALLIHRADIRLWELDAHLEHRVEFGYGILGQLSDKTRFFFAREEIVLHTSPVDTPSFGRHMVRALHMHSIPTSLAG